MRLAREIVAIFHGEDAAGEAEQAFQRVFQEGDLPEEIPEASFERGALIMEVLVSVGLASSKSEARRLIDQKGVRLDGEVLTDPHRPLDFEEPKVLQVGKRRFVRLIP